VLGFEENNSFLFFDNLKSVNPLSENQYFSTFQITKAITVLLVFETLKNLYFQKGKSDFF